MTEMTVTDPFNNRITFAEADREGGASRIMPELPKSRPYAVAWRPPWRRDHREVECGHRRAALARSSRASEKRLEGKTVEGLGRRRNICCRSVIGATCDDASRHVRLVPCRARRSEGKIAKYHHEKTKTTAHDHVVVSHVERRHRHLNDPRRFGSMKLVPRAKLDGSRSSPRSGRSARQ